MRLRRLLVMGALGVSTVGCGEAVGPPEASVADLDFFAPSVKPTASPSGFRTWNEPISRADSMGLILLGGGSSAAVTTQAQQIPLISRTFVAGEWNDKKYKLMYGMFGGGTGYTMTPRVRIVDEQGQTALDGEGMGRTENAPLYWYMRPTVEEEFTVSFACGGFAESKVLFEARMTFYGISPTIFSAQASDQATTQQPACPPPPTGGGYGPPPNGYTITICNYEAWVDAWGNIIAIFDYGCTSVGGPILAE